MKIRLWIRLWGHLAYLELNLRRKHNHGGTFEEADIRVRNRVMAHAAEIVQG